MPVVGVIAVVAAAGVSDPRSIHRSIDLDDIQCGWKVVILENYDYFCISNSLQ